MSKAVNEVRGQGAGEVAAPRAPQGGRQAKARSPFHIYKPGQGQMVRWGTAAGAAVIIIGFAIYLQEQLTRWQNMSEWVQYLIPVLIGAFLAYATFYLLGQHRKVVDFLIATEGEMKKVNWSTRREVIGATKVVIVTVLALGFILFAANILFMLVFESIGVLRVGMLQQLFGRGGQ